MKPLFPALLTPLLAVGVLLASSLADAQQPGPKPEQFIKWRQSNYQVLAWNTSRIKASLEGTYNKDEVVRASGVIAAIAASGLGALYPAGTDTGSGWHDTKVKPELFTDKRVAELSGDFGREAAELSKVAAGGDPAAVKQQFGKLTKTCKACHDDFRFKD